MCKRKKETKGSAGDQGRKDKGVRGEKIALSRCYEDSTQTSMCFAIEEERSSLGSEIHSANKP